jgi:hypothetical protein
VTTIPACEAGPVIGVDLTRWRKGDAIGAQTAGGVGDDLSKRDHPDLNRAQAGV